jgi:hypothetical protein
MKKKWWLIVAAVALAVLFVSELTVMRYRFSAESQTIVRVLRHAVRSWQSRHGSGCPDVERLVSDGELDAGAPRIDSWGQPFHITCDGGDVIVRSSGPDRVPNTADDVVVPLARR